MRSSASDTVCPVLCPARALLARIPLGPRPSLHRLRCGQDRFVRRLPSYSERIRDKIAASKRKGLWVGGMAPLGYDTKDRKITVNEAEAERVRIIFRSYLKLGSLNLLMADLRKRGFVTKVRTLKSGEKVGGIPFTRGPLTHLLRNRFYIGEVAFKGEVLNGEQTAIVDRALFGAVQAKLNAQVNARRTARTNTEALLAGRIFDDRGNRMTPSHARRRGIKYRYYLSSCLLQGQSERAGSVSRVPATEIEALVVRSVRERLRLQASVDDRALIEAYIARVDIGTGNVVIKLVQRQRSGRQKKGDHSIHIPWRKPPSRRVRGERGITWRPPRPTCTRTCSGTICVHLSIDHS
jgi:site-specific DNA recombinase